jgi:glycosyltransferase involved in cell wall biosynthesis
MYRKIIFVGNTGFSLFNFRLSLMRAMRDLGWSVIGVANDEADYTEKFKNEGMGFVHIPIDHKGKNPLRDLLLIQQLKALYRRESPEVVHHFTIKPVIFGSMAAKWAKVPAIVNTITGIGYVFEKGGLLMKIVIELYKLALSGRPKVIFQNKDDCQFFISKGIVRKSNARIILGSGVNTEILFPNMNKRTNGNLRFLLVSRMLWSKGIKEYVSAAEKIKRDFYQTSFIMAGGASGGGAKGNPEAIPEEWLNDVNKKGNVKWVGRIPFERVLELLDKSDVFILPSFYQEGIPRSLLEAAAKGKPIITTDAPGCREVVVDGVNGFLVPPRDIDSLVDCMIKFIQRPELVQRMGIESRKRAVEIFDERKILDQTMQIYKEAGVL